MRFTIRELLLVTVIVALAVAWWIDRGQLVQEVQRKQQVLDDFKIKLWTALTNSWR